MKSIKFAGLIALLLLVGCAGSKAGAGEGASNHPAVQLALPLIDAVEQYKSENGRYPADLEVLVPDYAEKIDQKALSRTTLRYRPWEQASSYRFEFKRGKETCVWTPEELDWVCEGR